MNTSILLSESPLLFSMLTLCRFSAIRSKSQTSVERELRSTCIPRSWRAVRAGSGPKTRTRCRMMFSGLMRMLTSQSKPSDRVGRELSLVPLVSSEPDPLGLLGRAEVGGASLLELICWESWRKQHPLIQRLRYNTFRRQKREVLETWNNSTVSLSVSQTSRFLVKINRLSNFVLTVLSICVCCTIIPF